MWLLGYSVVVTRQLPGCYVFSKVFAMCVAVQLLAVVRKLLEC